MPTLTTVEHARKQFDLTSRPLAIGRSPARDIQTIDPEASREHGSLRRNGGVHRTLLACLTITAAVTSARADILYVSNNGNPKSVQKYTSGGVGTIFVPGPAGATGLAFDSSANLYLSLQGGAAVSRYTPAGVPSTFYNTGLASPFALAFDSAGNLYIDNHIAHTIDKVTPAGVGSVFHNFGAQFGGGLAFDSAGNLYSGNTSTFSIERFTPAGAGTVFATNTAEPRGLAFDSAGNLYVGRIDNVIRKFSPTGADLGSFAAGGMLNSVYGLAFDSAGNLYAANAVGHTIVKFTPAGVGTLFADAADGINGPQFLAFTTDAGVPLPLANQAPLPTVACCNPATRACVLLAPALCQAVGMTAMAGNLTCNPNTCAALLGACCHGATCAVVAGTAACTAGGTYLGDNVACAPVARSGGVNACCVADFNNSAAISVQDIFDFLAAYFAGCP